MDLLPPHLSPHQTNPFNLATSFAFKRETTIALTTLLFLLPFLLLVLDAVAPFRPISLLQLAFPPQIPPDDDRTSHLPGETCNYSYGSWVRDEGHSDRFYSEGCPFLDPGFQCRRNGRNDTGYLNWRWRLHGCDLPRFNASEMLERSRNGRIVFVGDSIGRNHWESLVCMLARDIRNQSSIYEENGSPITKHKGFLAIRFDEYNLTVEYYRAPFLVVADRPPPNSPHGVRKAIRLDTMHWQSKRWVGADVLVFNAGHWWNADKTLKSGSYFQEGKALNMSMDVKEAFQRILKTWKLWLLTNVQLDQSYVFFRSFAPSHYSNGTWDAGGSCGSRTEPETDPTALEAEPWNNAVISGTIRGMEGGGRRVEYLNITYLSELRKDGHPSSHLEPGFTPSPPEDCSHWCLPGVPDTWNELLYAHLRSEGYDTMRGRRS